MLLDCGFDCLKSELRLPGLTLCFSQGSSGSRFLSFGLAFAVSQQSLPHDWVMSLYYVGFVPHAAHFACTPSQGKPNPSTHIKATLVTVPP